MGPPGGGEVARRAHPAVQRVEGGVVSGAPIGPDSGRDGGRASDVVARDEGGGGDAAEAARGGVRHVHVAVGGHVHASGLQEPRLVARPIAVALGGGASDGDDAVPRHQALHAHSGVRAERDAAHAVALGHEEGAVGPEGHVRGVAEAGAVQGAIAVARAAGEAGGWAPGELGGGDQLPRHRGRGAEAVHGAHQVVGAVGHEGGAVSGGGEAGGVVEPALLWGPIPEPGLRRRVAAPPGEGEHAPLGGQERADAVVVRVCDDHHQVLGRRAVVEEGDAGGGGEERGRRVAVAVAALPGDAGDGGDGASGGVDATDGMVESVGHEDVALRVHRHGLRAVE